MMTSRDLVKRCIAFQGIDRLPVDLPEKFGSDFVWVNMIPSPDDRPINTKDEWGALWKNIGVSMLGEVKEFPIAEWNDLKSLKIPDVNDPKRWESVKGIRDKCGEKFILGMGISMYERVHFLRGLENTWIDIYENPEELSELLDILMEMNIHAIDRYAAENVDGYILFDDWGLQNQLMISPNMWRKFWKPRYKKIFDAVHKHNMCTFLHSCGYIVEILDDLIEIGLDVVHMDQQENMGLELLGERFGGKLTFFAPVDIQRTMVSGSVDDIRQYCRKMVELLGRKDGGFIPRWYTDPVGAGHSPEALRVMCEEFLKISKEIYGGV